MNIGIIRRIDNLGRIVIPKEIRDTFRIKSSDNLEINVENEVITLKKYSELNNVIDIEKTIAIFLKEQLNAEVLITDKDKYIVVTQKEYLNQKINNELLNILEKRQLIVQNTNENNILINPIIRNGDIVGSIIIITKDQINENQIKTVTLLTNFLIKYIE